MSDFTIMLVDDDSDVLGAIGTRCRARGWNVLRAHNLLTAMSAVEMQRPDVLCTDVRLPTGNGLSFCEALAANELTKDIPVIVLTGQRDAETIRRCQQLGAHYIAKQPNAWSELEPAFDRLYQARRDSSQAIRPELSTQDDRACSDAPSGQQVASDETRRQLHAAAPPAGRHVEARPDARSTRTIVIADDDDDLVDSLTHRCSQLGYRVIGTGSAVEAINIIERVTPDLVCLDVNMPAGSGMGVCEMMSADVRLRSIPVIILTGNSDQQTIRRCHNMMVYYVERSVDAWDRLCPLIQELLGQDGNRQASNPPGTRSSATIDTTNFSKNEINNGENPMPRREAGTIGAVPSVVPTDPIRIFNPALDSNSLIDAVLEFLGSGTAAPEAEREDANLNDSAPP